ncbi:NAD(P)-dependent oxidoreductase [Microbacterium arabinogalactanolyticum]|uniref:NAD(P)-dependent oxidoreductase n=1 Tax=Microbacterium arabinogalactanolyticum TaxID=69365 RepID=UPI00255409B8|nr:NAD(P)H-binding protein [Microbacterium arabinogalactanolyticum]GLC85958.1 NAD-dependent epimerase [Microbacterium arabinogalactanolyticum]
MARIVVIGGTGYAGAHFVREGVSRGHDVVAVARKAPSDPIEGATYVQGSALDVAGLGDVLDGADAVISTISPRGDMADKAIDALSALIAKLNGTSTRLGVVGGAGGSLVAPGGPRLFDQGFPEEYKHEAQVGIDSLELLQESGQGVDWFFVHPAEVFGPWAEGVRTGDYRDGGDVIVRDADGNSTISGADFAVAFFDEIENPKHRRERFTVGY